MSNIELDDLLTPLFAIVLGSLVLWLLHKAKNTKFAENILTPLVIDIVTAGVLLYVLCIWVIGSLSVLVHTHLILPF